MSVCPPRVRATHPSHQLCVALSRTESCRQTLPLLFLSVPSLTGFGLARSAPGRDAHARSRRDHCSCTSTTAALVPSRPPQTKANFCTTHTTPVFFSDGTCFFAMGLAVVNSEH